MLLISVALNSGSTLIISHSYHFLCVLHSLHSDYNWYHGSYLFLDQKFKDFSKTFKDTFPIFQGLHTIWFYLFSTILCYYRYFFASK